jgi:hypothetical protein
VKTTTLRAGVTAAALGSLVLVAGACAKTGSPLATEATSVSTPTTPNISVSVPSIPDISTPGSLPGKEQTIPPKKATTTNKVATGGEFGTQSYDAFKAKFGDFKSLEYTIFLGDNQRVQAQIQDPAKPANVDQYTLEGGSISDAVPVKLSGDGSLEENVFQASTVAWDKLPDMIDQAKTSIPVEDSKGVTHIIVHKNLPFDNDTVVNVYVDGGARSNGGYVSFKADGSLKKVYGPS